MALFVLCLLADAAICHPPDGCLHGGHCSAPGHCLCAQDWEGLKCQQGYLIYRFVVAFHVSFMYGVSSFCSQLCADQTVSMETALSLTYVSAT